ncbi:hypothetical protein OG897_31290 [Streptomyces sp. NBC_00237]|uniref:hypothetical protein n=1 Tax=Streptomyces sp. NBC_00237 TaxID=2975687 RepID=UPI002256FA22|nr:hypothetical protein [Streptomyces sp. NBC_00237]MCX5205901.1 hypothetical protein [Streptomyces sp. NBC_00237]
MVKGFPSVAQDQITAIVRAVEADDLARLDELIDAFTQHAALPDLFALRTALRDALNRRP